MLPIDFSGYCVDRRIGGLEMSREVKKGQHEVDRRIGGLEKEHGDNLPCRNVDRRIGGLEKKFKHGGACL